MATIQEALNREEWEMFRSHLICSIITARRKGTDYVVRWSLYKKYWNRTLFTRGMTPLEDTKVDSDQLLLSVPVEPPQCLIDQAEAWDTRHQTVDQYIRKV